MRSPTASAAEPAGDLDPAADPAADSAASSAWAEIDRIREETLWSRMDTVLTTNALVRIAASGTWMVLALLTGADALWGAPMFAGGVMSLLHARRGMVLAVADHAGALAPVIRWLLPYPRVPHVNPVGLLDAAGAILANVGTGWIGGAFTTNPTAVSCTPAAMVLVALFDAGIVINMTGHVAWVLGPAGTFYVRVRSAVAPGCALITLALLWPAPGLGPLFPATLTMTVLATLGVLVGGWTAETCLMTTDRLLKQRFHAVRRAVQAVDGGHIHQLKNTARILYRRSEEIPDGDLRERIRRLCVSISSTEQMFKGGRGRAAQCVGQVVNGVLGLDERFSALRVVDADLDPRDLTPGDAELVAIAVGDLCSNAVNAGASSFRVGLRAEPAQHGSWLTLEAECVCGRRLLDVPEDSSLMRLATLLHYNRGTFVISDAEHSHTFTLRWPSTCRPRALPVGAPTPPGVAR